MSDATLKTRITGDNSSFNSSVSGAEKRAGDFKAAMKTVGADIKQAFAVAGVVAFGQAIGGVISESKALMDIYGKVADAAMELGISPESVQALQAFAEDAGLSADAFTGMIAKVRDYQDAIKAGGEESDKAALSLSTLGIAAEEFSQMKPGDAFIALSEALAKYEGDGYRAGKIFDILGTKGRVMQERLTDLGRQGGLDSLIAKYAESGQILDSAKIAEIDTAGDLEGGRRRAARARDVMSGLAASKLGGSSQVASDFEQGINGGIVTGGARGITQLTGATWSFLKNPINTMSEQLRGMGERIKGGDNKNLEGLSQKQIDAINGVKKAVENIGGAKF